MTIIFRQTMLNPHTTVSGYDLKSDLKTQLKEKAESRRVCTLWLQP